MVRKTDARILFYLTVLCAVWMLQSCAKKPAIELPAYYVPSPLDSGDLEDLGDTSDEL